MASMSKYADENQQNLHTKFPASHFLSNKSNMEHALLWNTFFRRNLHRFAETYLGLNLHFYQKIILYFMGISNMFALIACRAASKSFTIAIYACCICILKPYSKVVAASSTLKQANLIITEKIQNELMQMSPMLRKEIKEVKKVNSNAMMVLFNNFSSFTTTVASENSRGYRSTILIREECRMIDKNVDDSVLSPFQITRQTPYIKTNYYKGIPELLEEPMDIYISSSYYDIPEVWMWKLVDSVNKDMLNGLPSTLLAFDESAVLYAGIKTKKQLIQEKKKQDLATWKLEFLNLRIRDNTSAFFTYSMLTNRQVSKQVFYPRNIIDYKTKKKNKYFIPFQDNEFRVISNDIAFVAGNQNDNSVYACIRAIPEVISYNDEGGVTEIKKGYRRQYPYIESNQIGDTTKQAIRIRQLYEDFGGDGDTYIVVDCRGGGLQVLYSLQKVLYDDERKKEYEPLCCMNNEDYAKLCQDPSAKRCIYAVNATQNLNSEIAISFRKNLMENKIDFLVNTTIAKEEILSNNDDYLQEVDLDRQIDYERPFLETQAMISECAELQYEKLVHTNAIRIHEKGTNRKDRFSSVSYGSYFIDLMELDQLANDSDYDYTPLIN